MASHGPKRLKPFDKPMGCFDGAKCCEIVGLYLPVNISHNRGLAGDYRGDGLIAIDAPLKFIERTKKYIQKIYRRVEHKMIMEPKRKIVNFLEITIN